jgi:hypothetical protein
MCTYRQPINYRSAPRKRVSGLGEITSLTRFEQPTEHRTRPAAEIGNIP